MADSHETEHHIDWISEVLEVKNDVRTDDVHSWTLVSDLSYSTVSLGSDESLKRPFVFRVPKGSRTDFASIPRPLWWLAAPWGRHGRAGILHDYAYRQGAVVLDRGDDRMQTIPIARSEADYLFFSCMLTLDRLYNEASSKRLRQPRNRAVSKAATYWLFRVVLPVVRLGMTLAVVCFGWSAYKGEESSQVTAWALAATCSAGVGLLLLIWWLLGRLLGDVLPLGPVAIAGYLGAVALAIALLLVRITVELGERTLRRRLRSMR